MTAKQTVKAKFPTACVRRRITVYGDVIYEGFLRAEDRHRCAIGRTPLESWRRLALQAATVPADRPAPAPRVVGAEYQAPGLTAHDWTLVLAGFGLVLMAFGLAMTHGATNASPQLGAGMVSGLLGACIFGRASGAYLYPIFTR